jgi:regulatory protein YycI of two-component signal transduction system YycFG
MNRILTLLWLTLFSLTMACERPIDLTIEEPDPQLVVLSNFTADRNMQVRVSRTQSVLDTEPPAPVLDADVRLFKGEEFVQRLILLSEEGQDPFYTTQDFKPEIAVTYTIKVEAPGFAPIEAMSQIPVKIDIQSLKVSDYLLEKNPEGEALYRFSVTIGFSDPQTENNYYHLNLYQQVYDYMLDGQDTIFGKNEFFPIQFNQIIDNNFILAYFDGGVLFEDTPFNGSIVSYTFPISFNLNTEEEVPGKLVVELRSVSEEYYFYQRSLSQQQQNPGAPFAEPVTLYNNIVNGQGIFAGYSSSLDSVRVGR